MHLGRPLMLSHGQLFLFVQNAGPASSSLLTYFNFLVTGGPPWPILAFDELRSFDYANHLWISRFSVDWQRRVRIPELYRFSIETTEEEWYLPFG